MSKDKTVEIRRNNVDVDNGERTQSEGNAEAKKLLMVKGQVGNSVSER